MSADLRKALSHYQTLAPRYDHLTRRINAIRQRAIEALQLRPGDIVLDAGCGTGYCFDSIEHRIGPGGRIVGCEPSAQMLELARGRINAACWANIELIESNAEHAQLGCAPDAILFSYTHDLIRSRAALENLFAQAVPRARVAATSTKLYASWLVPANLYLRYTHREYITDFDGFAEPWDRLAEYLDPFSIETGPLTQHYIAAGRLK